MKDLLTQDGKPTNDLSKRMADNVVEALVTYLQAPGSATGEQVTVLSAALQSLATLAIAEQLQSLAVALAPDELTESATTEDAEEMCIWAWSFVGGHWYGACGYQAADEVDATAILDDGSRCPCCRAVIHRISEESVA